MRIVGTGNKDRQNEKPKSEAKGPHVKATCGAPDFTSPQYVRATRPNMLK
jgi:hypothetical protein